MKSQRKYSKGQRKIEESRQNDVVKARRIFSKVSAPVVSTIQCSRKSSRFKREREQTCISGRELVTRRENSVASDKDLTWRSSEVHEA